EYKKVKYVRVPRDVPAAGVRGDRPSWRTLKEILSASDKKIIQKLQQHGLPQYQCRGWKCRHLVQPQHLASGRGQSYLPLQTHAAVLFVLLIGRYKAAIIDGKSILYKSSAAAFLHVESDLRWC
ncbi:unnamed protein product, partial [Effrenium voratum]